MYPRVRIERASGRSRRARRAHPLDKRAGTDGALTPGNEIRLLDDDDREVAVGRDGEIVSRGPELFVGYTDPALDAESFLPGGWFRTGDIGRLDADGFLTITDRKKDVIIRGGENIASKEVEDLLRDASRRRRGRRRRRCPTNGTASGSPCSSSFAMARSLDLDDVAPTSPAGVARQKTPEHIVLVDEFPRNSSGKVRKVDLRETLRRASG